MLRDNLDRVEMELAAKDPRITGVELIHHDHIRNRMQLMVYVLHSGRQEMRLPVMISEQNLGMDQVSRVTGLILQAVELGTWGKHDFDTVRESISVTA